MLLTILILFFSLSFTIPQIALGQFNVKAPEGMKVDYVLLSAPFDIKNEKGSTYTALILQFETHKVPWKAILSPSNVYARLTDRKKVSARYFLFRQGWDVGAVGGRSLDWYEVKTKAHPDDKSNSVFYGVTLDSIDVITAQNSQVQGWFLFPIKTSQSIDAMTVGNITLTRSKH
jgi:hypothetical protein